MTDQTEPPRMAVIPVSVPGQDRILVRQPNIFIGVVGALAYPEAIMARLLIKARLYSADEEPNINFRMPQLSRPGDFELGADLRDETGAWSPTEVGSAGGGGGGYPDGERHYELGFWVALSAGTQGLELWCSWEERGVAKTAAKLDVDRIRAAALRCQPAWPT
jgi:hypothetical protein